MSHGRKKHLDFELNLIPFIDLLSTCICFLLLTAVWMNIASMNVKQTIGGQAQEKNNAKPMVWMNLSEAGEIALNFHDSKKIPKNLVKAKIAALQGRPNIAELGQLLAEAKRFEPGLVTALIQPVKSVLYEDIIAIMDSCKKTGMNDLGVVPL